MTAAKRELVCAQVGKRAKKPNGIMASNSVASRTKAVIVTLCWALVSHTSSAVCIVGPLRKDIEGMGQVQRRQ